MSVEEDIDRIRAVFPSTTHKSSCQIHFDRECGCCTCGAEHAKSAVAALHRIADLARKAPK